jgi:hypothetical protein
MVKTKADYHDRSDLEKLQSQWNKLVGLRSKDQASAAIVRCATAAEIAANYAIRQEFVRTGLSPTIVDGFLKWANGLELKMDKLLLPLRYRGVKSEEFKRLKTLSKEIGEKRNAIVHQGEFASQTLADELVRKAKQFIDTTVGKSVPGFDIKKKKKRSSDDEAI